MMDGTQQVKICPKCGSVYINWIAGGLIGAVYKCDDCNYVGPFILEVRARDLEKFRKELKKSSSEPDDATKVE
ncbi:MAG: hypothetical protein ACP5OC_00430 [Thermoplasmata archaeon]